MRRIFTLRTVLGSICQPGPSCACACAVVAVGEIVRSSGPYESTSTVEMSPSPLRSMFTPTWPALYTPVSTSSCVMRFQPASSVPPQYWYIWPNSSSTRSLTSKSNDDCRMRCLKGTFS